MSKIEVERKKGDWVCSAEFESFKRDNAEEHKYIKGKLEKLEPLADLIPDLQDAVKLRRNTEFTANRVKHFAKTAAIYLGVIAVILTIINAMRDIALDWFIKFR